ETSTSGKYEATYQPFPAQTDGAQIKILVMFKSSSSTPTSVSDFDTTKDTIAESNSLVFDTIIPTVFSPAELINPTAKSSLLKVRFSEGMNTNNLNTISNLTVTNETSGGLLTVCCLDGINTHNEATYRLSDFIDCSSPDSYSIDFNSNITDDAGNALDDIDTVNIDKADFDVANGLAASSTPVAGFTSDLTTGIRPLAVEFTDQSTSAQPDRWSWDFGDGNTSTEENPSHTYNISGNFTVSLTVERDFRSCTSQGGSDTETKTDFIIVSAATTETTSTTTTTTTTSTTTPTTPTTTTTTTTTTTSTTSTTIPTTGKSFTFNCDHSMKRGFFGLERLTMNVGDVENCTLKLTNHEHGQTKEVSTQITNWFWSGIKIEPARSVTDENGELKVTITAIKKGSDWPGCAVPNDKGQLQFNKKTYDTGFAWGMFVRVK
ncbi:MAG: PKD domain-containing protein, partial [Candidatus Anammoxibacter sp.]